MPSIQNKHIKSKQATQKVNKQKIMMSYTQKTLTYQSASLSNKV